MKINKISFNDGRDALSVHDLLDDIKELNEIVDMIFSDPGTEPKRHLALSSPSVIQIHEKLGDEGFKQMIENTEIATGTEGADYIIEFMNRFT